MVSIVIFPIIIAASFLFSVTQDSTLYEDLLSKGLVTWRTAGIFIVSRGAMVGAYSISPLWLL